MNKKQKIIIICCFIVIIFFILLGVSKYFGGYIIGDDVKFTNNISTSNARLTHIIFTSNNDVDNIKGYIVYTFQEDKCISQRIKFVFANEETAKEQYENWKKIPENTNIEINENEVCFNANSNIGKTKQEILDSNTMEYEIF